VSKILSLTVHCTRWSLVSAFIAHWCITIFWHV